MEQNLISKKDLLRLYGISYGALYRWKRMGLIPEEWFVKKAMPSGQETFFPRALVCERVEQIVAQKNNCSLEELARQFQDRTQRDAALVIDTVLGKKVIYLHEIRCVTLVDGKGGQVDLTKQLTEGESQK